MAAELAFLLDVNHDELEVTLEAVLRVPDTIVEREDLEEALRENNVLAGVDKVKIDEAFASLETMEEPGAKFVIANGKRPKHGQNGKIDFKLDVSGQASYIGAEADEDENVDFREAMKIVSVKPGEVIAELIPPTMGEDGYNLAGKPLPAKKGKGATLRAGEGVSVGAAGNTFEANCQGRPVFSAGTLTVSPIYEVPGDVDFNTGNIKFDGHVIVTGNVQDDFSVEANSIEILGVVGACTIKSQGPLEIRGGVNGRERAEIYSGSTAFFKYLNQAGATAMGDITVSREIVNSRVWCRGKVKAEKVIGGECLALSGVEAAILGSDMGVSTVIEPGANFEVRKLENTMGAIADKIEGLLRPISPFFGDKNRYKGLPDEKKQEYTAAFENFLKLKEAYVKLMEERASLVADSGLQPVKQVIVRKLVHADVFIRTDLCMKQFKTQVTGPVALIEDIDASTIRPANYVPGKGIVDEDQDEEY